MKVFKKRQGSSYFLVILAFLVITLFSTLTISGLNNGITRTHAYALQMKAYYLNREMLEATVSALRANGNNLLKTTDTKGKVNPPITHINEETKEDIGETVVKIKKVTHKYYGKPKEWIEIQASTKIKDERADKQKKGEKYSFSFEGRALVLIENPVIQLYNVDVESLTAGSSPIQTS